MHVHACINNSVVITGFHKNTTTLIGVFWHGYRKISFSNNKEQIRDVTSSYLSLISDFLTSENDFQNISLQAGQPDNV